jgi:hypothetical protein
VLGQRVDPVALAPGSELVATLGAS